MFPRDPIDEIRLPGFVQIEPVGHCTRLWSKGVRGLRDEGAPFSAPALYRYDAFCRLVDELPPQSELELRGIGEPLLHPRFFDMVRYAAARGIRVSTETDLPTLSERRADECAASGLRRLRVRAKSAASAALSRLARLTAAKRRARTPWPVVTVVTGNREALSELVRRAAHGGAEAVELGEGPLPEDAVALAKALDIRLKTSTSGASASGAQGSCDWPWRKAFVSVAGEAKPCCMPPPQQGSMGNVDRLGLAAVWHGPALREFRAQLASDQPPRICRDCANYRSNDGGS
jgi:MoaA/NifB/PqqE/SkfB family radical SAM enzyme